MPLCDAADIGTRRAAIASPLAPVARSCTASDSRIHQRLGPRRAGRQAPPLTCCASLAAGCHRQGACSFRRCKHGMYSSVGGRPSAAQLQVAAAQWRARFQPAEYQRRCRCVVRLCCVLQLPTHNELAIAIDQVRGRSKVDMTRFRRRATTSHAPGGLLQHSQERQNVWNFAETDCALAPVRTRLTLSYEHRLLPQLPFAHFSRASCQAVNKLAESSSTSHNNDTCLSDAYCTLASGAPSVKNLTSEQPCVRDPARNVGGTIGAGNIDPSHLVRLRGLHLALADGQPAMVSPLKQRGPGAAPSLNRMKSDAGVIVVFLSWRAPCQAICTCWPYGLIACAVQPEVCLYHKLKHRFISTQLSHA